MHVRRIQYLQAPLYHRESPYVCTLAEFKFEITSRLILSVLIFLSLTRAVQSVINPGVCMRYKKLLQKAYFMHQTASALQSTLFAYFTLLNSLEDSHCVHDDHTTRAAMQVNT